MVHMKKKKMSKCIFNFVKHCIRIILNVINKNLTFFIVNFEYLCIHPNLYNSVHNYFQFQVLICTF